MMAQPNGRELVDRRALLVSTSLGIAAAAAVPLAAQEPGAALTAQERANLQAVRDLIDALAVADWDRFHRSYDEWRKAEGGCDRAEVVSELGRFALQFSAIFTNVRGLPRATSLRPMGELLVEAARLEEQALKELRNSWQPFDDGAFQGLDRDRSTADKLRRQVALGIQELLERYGLSEQETGS